MSVLVVRVAVPPRVWRWRVGPWRAVSATSVPQFRRSAQVTATRPGSWTLSPRPVEEALDARGGQLTGASAPTVGCFAGSGRKSTASIAACRAIVSGHCGGSRYRLEADDLDAAIELAARVPAVRYGGAVEIHPSEVYW